MRHKNLKSEQIKIITITYIVLFFVIISYSINPNRKLNTIESIMKDSYSNIEKIINKNKLNLIETFKEYNALENKKVTNKARISELETEIERLKKTLDLNSTLADYNYVNATIINHNNEYWYNTIKIDKGSIDGIKKNMTVINNDGLIGKVISTTKKTSIVELLSNDNYKNKISIKIETEDITVYGLLTLYNSQKNLYHIEGISEKTEIKAGNLIKTTGFSEIYPGGIVVGTVSKITTDNFDLTKIIEATPSVNFNGISYVTVLIGNKND